MLRTSLAGRVFPQRFTLSSTNSFLRHTRPTIQRGFNQTANATETITTPPPHNQQQQQHASTDATEMPSTAAVASTSLTTAEPLLLESGRVFYRQRSLFRNRPPAVVFHTDHKALSVNTPPNIERVHLEKDIRKRNLYFKIHERIAYEIVRLSFLNAGFKRVNGEDWNVYWGRRMKPDVYRALNAFQKVNHFPGTANLGCKNLLTINLDRMKGRLNQPNEYDFYPETFLLPFDAQRFEAARKSDPAGSLYIRKPNASSCGRDIRVITQDTPAPGPDESLIIQRYIANPLLVDGFKFDLRLYVAVTSFNPLRVYIYDDGLTRFATRQYNESSVRDRYAHLTNYSVNKYSSTFVTNTNAEEDDLGSKWSVKALKRYFSNEGIPQEKLWEQINDMIVKTLVSVESIIVNQLDAVNAPRNSCFELYGFDVMIDSNLKPWLIEVNLLPSLSCSSPLDKRIKYNVVTELFNMLGVIDYDRANYQSECDSKLQFIGTSTASSDAAINEAVRAHNWTHQQKLAIQETEDEYSRRGNFQRIFPPPPPSSDPMISSDEQQSNKAAERIAYNEKILSFLDEERPLNNALLHWHKLRWEHPTKAPQLFDAVSEA